MEPAMRHLSGFVGIDFDTILLTPTFNGSPISANTSFSIENSKIIESTLSRYKTLAAEEIKAIESMTADLYQAVLKEAVHI